MAHKSIDYEGYRIEQHRAGDDFCVFRDGRLGLVLAKCQTLFDATAYVDGQMRGKRGWAWKLGTALEAWLPVRDLLMAQAEEIERVRNDCIESCCPEPAYGEPYDLSLITEYRDSIDPLQEMLDRTNALLGTDYGAPHVYHWDGEDMPDEAEETAEMVLQ